MGEFLQPEPESSQIIWQLIVVISRQSVPASASATPELAPSLSHRSLSSDGAAPKLYDLVLELEPDLRSVAVGSTTFRAAIASFIELLIDHPTPTMMWSKLPRGESWQQELERYCKQSAKAQVAYSFFMQQELEALPGATAGGVSGRPFGRASGRASGPVEDTLLPLELTCPAPGRLALLNGAGQDWLADNAVAPMVSVPLERGGDLSGEYFVLVTSPEFQGLILARRFKPGNSNAAGALEDSAVISPGNESETDRGEGDSAIEGQRSQLRMVYSCNPVVICRVLEQIRQTLTQVPTNRLLVNLGGPTSHAEDGQKTQAASQAAIPVEALLRHWGQLFITPGASSPEMELLNQWVMQQFQRQEGLWRRLNNYRRQAEQAETYQLQHEELLNGIRLKDEFLSMVVHELRTPLTNMKTALSLLNSPSLKPAQRQRYVQLLNTECDRQGSLISGLLNLSQIEQSGETEMQPLALGEILPGVVSTYQPLAQEKDIVLAYSIPDTLPPVSCLVPWLRQVVVNLLHNSIKFTGKDGRVWVRAKRQGDYVQIDIQDTGIGIAASEIPKIFNRFYRVRAQGLEESSGAGLGLTIVQQLLLRCGGSITVNSRLNQGATFSVLLPIYRQGNSGEALELESD